MVGKTGPQRAVTDEMKEKKMEEIELNAGWSDSFVVPLLLF